LGRIFNDVDGIARGDRNDRSKITDIELALIEIHLSLRLGSVDPTLPTARFRRDLTRGARPLNIVTNLVERALTVLFEFSQLRVLRAPAFTR